SLAPKTMWSNMAGLASEHAQGIGRIRRDFLANVAHLDDPLALEAQDVDDRDLAGRLLALQVRQGSHPVLRFDRLLDLERLVRLAGRALLHRLEQRLAILCEPWVVVAEVPGDETVVGLADAAAGAQGQELGGDFGFGALGGHWRNSKAMGADRSLFAIQPNNTENPTAKRTPTMAMAIRNGCMSGPPCIAEAANCARMVENTLNCTPRPTSCQAMPSPINPTNASRAQFHRLSRPMELTSAKAETSRKARKNRGKWASRKAANGGASGGGAWMDSATPAPLNSVCTMMFCRIATRVPKPDRTMEIHARTVTNVDLGWLPDMALPWCGIPE